MCGDRRHGPPRRLGQTAQQGDASPEVLQPDSERVPGIAQASGAVIIGLRDNRNSPVTSPITSPKRIVPTV